MGEAFKNVKISHYPNIPEFTMLEPVAQKHVPVPDTKNNRKPMKSPIKAVRSKVLQILTVSIEERESDSTNPSYSQECDQYLAVLWRRRF